MTWQPPPPPLELPGDQGRNDVSDCATKLSQHLLNGPWNGQLLAQVFGTAHLLTVLADYLGQLLAPEKKRRGSGEVNEGQGTAREACPIQAVPSENVQVAVKAFYLHSCYGQNTCTHIQKKVVVVGGEEVTEGTPPSCHCYLVIQTQCQNLLKAAGKTKQRKGVLTQCSLPMLPIHEAT